MTETYNVEIIETGKNSFVGRINNQTIVEIKYVGWASKGIRKFAILITDNGKNIFNEIKKFENIGCAFDWIIDNIIIKNENKS